MLFRSGILIAKLLFSVMTAELFLAGVVPGHARAEVGSIRFAGSVGQLIEATGKTRLHPEPVRSFTNRAALPVPAILLDAVETGLLTVHALEDGGARGFSILRYTDVTGKPNTAVVVQLNGRRMQRFVLCDRLDGTCMQYSVLQLL